MKQGVVLDWDCIGPDISQKRLADLPIHWTFYGNSRSDQLEERLKGMEIAVAGKVSLKKETLSRSKTLKLIAEMATGTDNIDVAAAKELGIAVCNVPAYSTDSVAQLVLLFILSLLGSAQSYQNTKKEWPQSPLFTLFNGPIHEAKNKTVGIMGAGQIGQEVGRLCRPFGMKTIFMASRDPKRSQPGALPLEQILPIADFITLHLPLTAETKHLFNEKHIFAMKKGAFLINTARGGLIEEKALAKALKEGHLSGAALDVLSQEPPPKDHLLLDPALTNLLITPHIGWASIEARERLAACLLENIRDFLNGQPKNLV